MKKIIELNEDDIKYLVAKEYNVEDEAVSVLHRTVTRGYGIGEYEEYETYVVVNT